MNVDKTAKVLTWGCTHNQKDSQLIEQKLIDEGYELVETIDQASTVIFNTCTVKSPTENKIIHFLDKLKIDKEKKVIVSGCLSQSDPDLIRKRYPNFIVLGVNAAGYISQYLNDSPLKLPLIEISPKFGPNATFFSKKKDFIDKPKMKSNLWNKNINIIQINEGCVNSCTFCATKFARGQLRSYSKESIIKSIRENFASEIWLTSQDTACWGFDKKESLGELLTEINAINRKFWIRIGMGNPNNFIKILDKIINIYKTDKVYKFLHLPLQSGSNKVLQHMKRGYTVEEYEYIVEKFKASIPNITIATDVITGYPTETDLDFEMTISALKNTRPSITNISRYWERKNTYAASLKQLPLEIRKKRSNILTKLCKKIQYEDNQSWINWEGDALLNEKGPKGGIQARNLFYKPIILNLEDEYLGQWQKIRITKAKSTYFYGEII